MDWSRITLYWGDERAVPPDHPDSNYGLAERVLLRPLGGRAPNAVRMDRRETTDLAPRRSLRVTRRPICGSARSTFSSSASATMATSVRCFPAHRAGS